MCSLILCLSGLLSTPSLTVCAPSPLISSFFSIYLFFHLSQPPPTPPLFPPSHPPSMPLFLYVSGRSAGCLLSSTFPDIPRLGSQTTRQAAGQIDRQKKSREEGRVTARQLLQQHWQAGGKATKKIATGRQTSKETAERVVCQKRQERLSVRD